jgi:DNA-binding NtrC family response regulator
VLLAEQFLKKITREYNLPPKQLSEAAKQAILAHSWPGNVRELYHAIERAVLSEENDVVEPPHLALHSAPSAPLLAESNGSINIALPAEGVALEDVERSLIERALEREKGNVTRAAALLKMSRDTLRSRVEKFGISPKRYAS